jgi:hypothetical protein
VTKADLAKAILEKKGVKNEDPYNGPLREAVKGFMEAVKSEDEEQAVEFLKDAIALGGRE